MKQKYAGDTQCSAVTAAAPGAGAFLSTITAPRNGTYEIRGTLRITGTAAEVKALNAELEINGVSVMPLPTGQNSTTPMGVEHEFVIPRIAVAGTRVIRIEVLTAATALTVYTSTLTVTELA